MAVEIKSRKGIVSKAPYELYMVFADMRNFVQFLPEDKKEGVEADYDWIHAQVQGFNIGVKVTERIPYSRIEFADDGAPFQFGMTLHFDPSADPYKTDFQIAVSAELNVEFIMAGKTSTSPKNTNLTTATTKAIRKNAIQI